MEKPKNLHHQSNAGILGFFQGALNTGKGVQRITSDSIAGKKAMNTKGSCLASDEPALLVEALKAKWNRPKHGGAKEIARHLKQIQRNKHASSI